MRSCVGAALLLLAILVPSRAWGAASGPSVETQWTVQVPNTAQVPLVSQGIVFVSTQTDTTEGQFNNTVQATTATKSSLWVMSSLGPVQTYTTAYAFPSIPKLIFLLVNNIQPPNVTAVIPYTGTVVWSTQGAFSTFQGGSLASSVDGSTLYLYTFAPGGSTQTTAVDVESGAVLFAESEPMPLFTPVQCGAGVGCIVNCTDSAEVVFLDGRNGTLLGSVQLSTILSDVVDQFEFVSQSLVLATIGASANQYLVRGITDTLLYMINTTSYTIAWSFSIPAGTTVQLQSLSTGSTFETVLILSNSGGFSALDAVTGLVMWSTPVDAICPSTSPAPGYASRFYDVQYQIGQSVNAKFAFFATCAYGNGQHLDIFGWVNITNGALTYWNNLSYLPFGPPTPVGASYFMMRWNGTSSYAANYNFFYTGDLTTVGLFPPRQGGCQDSYSASVQGSDVIFVLNCWWWGLIQVSSVTVG